jgi:glycosyltransferase involved in cell wall biosynthesis
MKKLRIVSFVEGHSLTGPIRPLLTFARHVSRPEFAPPVHSSFITTARPADGKSQSSGFLDAALAQHTEVDIVLERHACDARALGQLRAILELRKPDIIETHSFKPHFLMSFLRSGGPRLHNLRWIAFHHGYTSESLKVRFYNQFDRWSLPRADRVITLCKPFAAELAQSRGVDARRIEVIKNAIEPKPRPTAIDIARLRAEFGIDADERVILSVGRLSPEKGHSDLLRAFAALVGMHPTLRLRLLFVGDGVERATLTAASASLGEKVLFAGHRADVWPFYGLAHVFVLPSHSEGSPMVLFEAMLAGLPIVATAVGGVPETLVDARTALLIPPRDPSALSAALNRVLHDDALAMTLAHAATLELSRFSVESYCRTLLGIYASVMAKSARP